MSGSMPPEALLILLKGTDSLSWNRVGKKPYSKTNRAKILNVELMYNKVPLC